MFQGGRIERIQDSSSEVLDVLAKRLWGDFLLFFPCLFVRSLQGLPRIVKDVLAQN